MPQRVKVTTEDGNSVILTLDDDQAADAPQQAGAAGGGLGMAAMSRAAPMFQRIAEEAATNPAMKRIGAGIGQLTGGLGALYKTHNPLEAAGGAWLGGRMGWHTGALLQKMASPVAAGLQKMAPAAEAMNPLGAAAGVGDLAQMAEPQRKDIGFLGIGPSQNVPGQQPALLNLLWQKLTGGQ